MFIVRNIFHCKPGKAKALIEIFKKASPMIEDAGLAVKTRIISDASADFWTVVIESEVENLNNYINMAETISKNPELGQAMAGYTDLVLSGKREIFRIE
jgi:hypothetical protein